MTTVTEFLLQPLTTTVGQPLRVAVYSRIARGIRDGVLPLGSALPRETELCSSLGVSRTVVREALMLLEEDGLISTRRGVGRFVTSSAPKTGLEVFRPLEKSLSSGDDPLTVDTVEFTMQPTSEFVSPHLNLDAAANTWFRESVLRREEAPVALVQELLPAGRYLSDISPEIDAALTTASREAATLPASLTEMTGVSFSAAAFQITPSVVGDIRGRILDLDATDPVIVLTQVLEVNGSPVYLCKCVVSPTAGPLTVFQDVA